MSRTSTSTLPPSTLPPPESQTQYNVKWILDAQQQSVPILMQNHNGPCALLALINASIQTSAISIQPGTTTISEQHMMSLLIDYAMSTTTGDTNPAREHAVNDFIEILPGLTKGVDINVRFHDTTAFEFTRELGVFDIFPNIRLVHGWLFDPQDTRLASALDGLSYNQVIDELVRTELPEAPSLPSSSTSPPDVIGIPSQDPNSPQSLTAIPSAPLPGELEKDDDIGSPDHPLDPSAEQHQSKYTETIRDARPRVVEFLEMNPTQLTVYGLLKLHEALKENETAILFRNSHFSVIRKHKGAVYTLISDVGFLREVNTVWEQLSDVTGASSFYNGAFQKLNDDGSVPRQQHVQNRTGQQQQQARQRPSQVTNAHAPRRSPANATGRPMATAGGSGLHLRNSYAGDRHKDKGCVIQ